MLMIHQVMVLGFSLVEKLFLRVQALYLRAQVTIFDLFKHSSAFKVALLFFVLVHFVYTTVVGLYFEQFGNRYTFSNILLDYNFGIIRRGLTGEIASWIFDLPIEYKDYLIFYHIRFGVLTAMFFAIFVKLIKKGSPFLLILLPLVTYPTLLRFVWSDFGRTEPWGTLACLCLFFIPNKNLAKIFVIILVPILMLFHINQLVTHLPALFLIYWLFWGGETKTIFYFGIYAGVSFFVVSYLSVPDVDVQTLFQYIQSKTTDMTYQAKNFQGPYTGVFTEMLKSFYKPQYWVMVLSLHWNLLIMPLSIYFLYLCFEKSGLKGFGSRFGTYALMILIPYGVVFLLTDYGRFFQHTQHVCIWFFWQNILKHLLSIQVFRLKCGPGCFGLLSLCL